MRGSWSNRLTNANCKRKTDDLERTRKKVVAWKRKCLDARQEIKELKERRAVHSQELPNYLALADDVADDPAAVRHSNFTSAFVKYRHQMSSDVARTHQNASEVFTSRQKSSDVVRSRQVS